MAKVQIMRTAAAALSPAALASGSPAGASWRALQQDTPVQRAVTTMNFSPAAESAKAPEDSLEGRVTLIEGMRSSSPISPHQTLQGARVEDIVSPQKTECSIGFALNYVKETFITCLQKVYDVVRPYFPCCNREGDNLSTETRLAQIEEELATRSFFFQRIEERVVDLEDDSRGWLKFLQNNMPAPISISSLKSPDELYSEFFALVRYINEKVDAATQRVNDREVNINAQVNEVRKAVNCIRKMQGILDFLQEEQNLPEQKREILQAISKIVKETDEDLGSYMQGLYIDGSPTLIQKMILEAYEASLQAYFPDRRDLIAEVREWLLQEPLEGEEDVEEY